MSDKIQKAPKPKNTAIAALGKYPKGYILRRVLAAVIDLVAVSLLVQLAFLLFGQPDWQHYMNMAKDVAGLSATDPIVIERMNVYQNCFILSLAIGAGLEFLCMFFFGGSIGKLFMGMRVVNVNPNRNFWVGKLMLLVRAVLKSFSIYLLSAIPFIFLSLTVFGNKEGKSGFDSFIGTKTICPKLGVE